MKSIALAIAIALLSSAAYADNVVIGCPLLKKYGDGDVNMMLTQARSVVNEREIGQIYARYLSLKSACQTNARASRVVPVSPVLRGWLAQNGIDISRL